MDYQVFLVRVTGGALGKLGGRGGVRILRVFDSCISVSNPSSYIGAAPGCVEYLFENISNVLPSTKHEHEVTINVPDRNERGYQTLHIFCECRSELITALLNKLDDLNGIGTDFSVRKHSHESGELAERVLRVRSASIVKMLSSGFRNERLRVNPAKKINFNDIVKVQTLSDDEHIVLLYVKSRMLRLSLPDVQSFIMSLSRNMKFYLNRKLEVEKINTATMVENVAVYNKQAKELPYMYEFQATKHSLSRDQERNRIIYVSSEHFVEMAGDEVVAIHILSDIIGLIVNDKNTNEVTVEFKSWRSTQYFVDERDDFIASMADVCRSSLFDIRPVPFFRHMLPHNSVNQFDYETYCINRLMSEFNGNRDPAVLHIILKEFASNVNVGRSQCNDYRVVSAMVELLKDWYSSEDFVRSTTCCIAISRLLGSRNCFEYMKSIPNLVSALLQCMSSGNAVLVYNASVTLRHAFKFSGNFQYSDTSILKQEQMNKFIVLRLENMQQFTTFLNTFSLDKDHILQAYGMVGLFAKGLENLSLDTEAGRAWIKAFESCVMTIADILCLLSRSKGTVLRESTATLLEALLTKTSTLVSSHFRSLCLRRCLFIVHLNNSLFSKTDINQSRSARLIFYMMEGDEESKQLLQSLLPKGTFHLYDYIAAKNGKDKSTSYFRAWVMLLEALRRDTFETPLFIWNDLKRTELQKFLEQEIEGFNVMASSNPMVYYDIADVNLVYSPRIESEGTIVADVHLELLVDNHSPADEVYSSLWKLHYPLRLFQAVFQALVLGFTPFFGHNNIPEVDLRLAVEVLTWIYERHASDVNFSLQTSNVIEASVGMLQEVIHTEHQVFVFKLVVFLLTMMENGGRENVLRFVNAGGISALTSLLVLSLAQCCNNKTLFESDMWYGGNMNPLETVQVTDSNGKVKLVRVPSGRVREVLDKALLNGSLDAKQAIKWQDAVIPSKIQFGLVLDVLEALLRVSGCENKIECFPPPAVCIYLSREEVMCHLIQSLLRAKTPAFGRILSIISHVVRMNRPAMTQMVKLGTFEILLWKLAAGDIADADRRQIITFFKVWNIYQKDSCSCILDMYLPEGLALKLMSEDTDGFLTLLGSEENSPEVVWNNSMLETLVKHLSRQLESYVRSRATDPMALYIRAPRTVHYEDLTDAVFSSPFYLHNLLDTERFPNYPINDPLKFLNNLMEESNKLANDLKQSSSNGMASSFWKKHISKIHLLLGSMAYLLERFVKLSHPHDMEAVSLTLATPAVFSSAIEDFVVSDVIYQTTRVLKRIRTTQPREGETLSGAVQFALSVLSLGTHLKPDGSFPEHISGHLELAIAGALIVLETTCESRVGRELLQKDLRWKSGLWWALCAAAGDAAALVPAGPSPVSFAALNCLKHYVNNEEAVYIFNQGLHLPLILLAFSSATRQASGYKTGLAYSAAEVLRSLAIKDSNFLRNIIPDPLFKGLVDFEGPERFLTMQTSDFTEPKAIWNFHVREELRDSIYDRLCYHGAMMAANEIVEDDEVTWLQDFRYNSLSDELVINGYYIRGLVNCNLHGADFELQSELLNSLLVFLVEHKTDDKIVEDYLSVLTALEECITHAVNKNMESMLENSKLAETLSSIILQCMDTLHVHVQLGFARIAKKLIAGNMSHMVMESRVLEALTVQLWESAAEGREVVQCTLEALHFLSEQIPATIEATNCFSEHATLLPLLALFCNVHLPVLHSKRIPAASAPTCKEHRLIAAKVLGHILLTGKGVSRRAKLVEDLQRCKLQEVDEGITEATDMYELFSIVEQHEHAKSIRSLMLLLPLGILSALARDTEEACKIYDSSCSSPMLVWDETRREQVKSVIGNEAARVHDQVNDEGTYGLPAWSLDAKRPIFLCFTVATTEGEEMKKPRYRLEYEEEYAMELYLGGFYVDEFLRNYKYNFDPVLEQRFLHELRTALVIGTSTGGLYTEAFTFDDRRRLLLGLLLLWKLHTHLLTSRSNVDVVLPLYEIIRESGESRNERKALAQPAMMLLHCAATHPDIADCIVSEELVYSLSSIISLAVPYNYSLINDVGTDPRLCSLSLLIRLLRLSNNAVDTVVRLGVMSKLEELVLDFDVSTALKRKAAECLAIMCADKRKGNEVKAILEKLVPRNAKGYGSWKMPLNSIKDEIADMRTIEHFLRFRYPSPWWNSDSFTDDDTHNSRSPHSIVEASICFSRARLSDFNNEVETVFRRIIASMASVEVKAVQILRKRIAGSVFIDFEVNFQKPEGDMNGNLFKEKLERITREAFTNTLVEAMGAPKVTMVSLKRVEIPIEKKSITLHRSLDKNVIYVPQVPTVNSKTISPSQVHITPHTNGGSFIHLLSSPRTNSFPLSSNTETATHINIPPSKLDINSPSTPLTLPLKSHTDVHGNKVKVNGNAPPPPPLPSKPMYTNGASVHGNKVNGEVNGNPPPPPPLPPKPHTNGMVNGKVNGNPPPPPPLPPKPHTNGTASTLVELHKNASEVNGSYANGTYKLHTNGTYTNGATVHGENGNGKHVNGLQEGVVTDGPLVDEAPVSGSNIMVKSEEGRLVPVEKGLELVLQGADISKENQQVARSNFLEAFEDEPKELGKMVEKYPKLVQKYPLQPQVCYDMVTAWEENCLNLLTADEMRKYGRSIAAFDMCRFDNPEVAVEEAKKKFQGILIIRREQEWKEKRKQLKGDMSAELAKAVGDRKEKVLAGIEKDELKTLSVGKIQKKKQSSP